MSSSSSSSTSSSRGKKSKHKGRKSSKSRDKSGGKDKEKEKEMQRSRSRSKRLRKPAKEIVFPGDDPAEAKISPEVWADFTKALNSRADLSQLQQDARPDDIVAHIVSKVSFEDIKAACDRNQFSYGGETSKAKLAKKFLNHITA